MLPGAFCDIFTQACAVAVVHLGTHLQEHSIVLRQSYGRLAKLSGLCRVDGPYK